MNTFYTLALTSVYIFNSQGQYLTVGDDGKPAISNRPVKLEVSMVDEKADAGRMNFNGKDVKWILKSSAGQSYTLGYQDSDAYSTAFVYAQSGAISTSFEEPDPTFAAGQWKVAAVAPYQEIILDEAQDYVRPTFSEEYVDVTLKRKFKTGQWNSLCLPFPLSAAQIAETWGVGTKVAYLTSDSDTKLFFTYRTDLEAGQPCLLQPERVNEDQTYKFAGITASSWYEGEGNPEYTVGQTRVTGFFSPTIVKSRSYVFSADKIYHLTSDMNAKGFRIYFEDVAGPQSARELTWSVDENPSETNDISSVLDPASAASGDVYGINGQRVRHRCSSTKLAPGVYIVNGIKLIVK